MKISTGLFVLGGLGALLLAAKAGAVSAEPTPPTPTPTPTKPKPTTVPVVVTNVPLTVVDRVIASGTEATMRANAVWLNDNGYPKTGAAMIRFADGDITAAELRSTATAEFTKAKPKGTGTLAADEYGMGLLASGTDDEVYGYALTSNSIPVVRGAAARLAARGDTRALELTTRLAAIS